MFGILYENCGWFSYCTRATGGIIGEFKKLSKSDYKTIDLSSNSIEFYPKSIN